MRGSDENASLYWLGRMLEGGEDPLYVARRMVRFASEDVGKKHADERLALNYFAFAFITLFLSFQIWEDLKVSKGSFPYYICLFWWRHWHVDIYGHLFFFFIVIIRLSGMADPAALTQAVSAFQACHLIGMPECEVGSVDQSVTHV